MGYWLRPQIVREYENMFRLIQKKVVEKGEEIRLKPAADKLSSERYKLNQALKCAEVFKEELGGKFAGLKEQVKVTVDSSSLEIVILGKRERVSESIVKANETIALQQLESYRGELTVLNFFPSPSFDPDSFRARAESIGFRVHLDIEEDTQEDGSIMCPAERIEEKTDPLRELGFRR